MSSTNTSESTQNKWAELLVKAITEPGLISQAYSTFHNYSTGNQILAILQCIGRNITPGPIATYKRWQELGRQVLKGAKAIELCMPVTAKIKAKDENEKDKCFTRFIYRRNWFVLCQTEGKDLPAIDIPEWNKDKALAKLEITEIPYDHPNGNVMGFARGKSIAISPLNQMPHKTLFHELAHIILGHTEEGKIEMADTDLTPRDMREVEAESVALLCCESLGLPGQEYSHGYIQNWLSAGGRNVIPEKSAQKIFHAADVILKAGVQ